MRGGRESGAIYTPSLVPTDPKDLPRFLGEELRKLQACIAILAAGHVDKTFAEPDKFEDGDVVYADGTSWKPNGTGGVGFWYYNEDSALWIQLG